MDDKAEPLEYPESPRQSLIKKIKGNRIVIPDMYGLLPGWRFNLNNAYRRMHPQTDSWLLSWTEDPHMRKRIVAADFAKLSGTFYPDADEERYRMMAYYLGWVFVWDDEIDCGSLKDNETGTKLYQKQTNDFLTYTLGSAPFIGEAPEVCDIVEAFGEIAAAVEAGCSSDARARVLHELQKYVNKVCDLQSERQSFLPTVEQHLEGRRRTGGVGVNIALIEYVYGLDIPKNIIEHEAMQTIWLMTNDLVTLVDDMASFAKEFVDDQLDNLIPLLVHQYDISPQAAMNHAAQLVREAFAEFEAAERRLPLSTGNAKLDQDISRFVQGCKDIAAGNIRWSYETKRYFGTSPVRDGNCIILNM